MIMSPTGYLQSSLKLSRCVTRERLVWLALILQFASQIRRNRFQLTSPNLTKIQDARLSKRKRAILCIGQNAITREAFLLILDDRHKVRSGVDPINELASGLRLGLESGLRLGLALALE